MKEMSNRLRDLPAFLMIADWCALFRFLMYVSSKLIAEGGTPENKQMTQMIMDEAIRRGQETGDRKGVEALTSFIQNHRTGIFTDFNYMDTLISMDTPRTGAYVDIKILGCYLSIPLIDKSMTVMNGRLFYIDDTDSVRMAELETIED